MAAAMGALHSDHMNYLIFRYLQEHGLEKTAQEFHKEWQRPYEFRDPETLPFAPIVRRGELISVVQNGLWHDELLAQVPSSRGKSGRRQFRWTAVSPREALADGQDIHSVLLENGTMQSSRPSSSEKRRKGRPSVHAPNQQHGVRAPDEFPTPPPKRARRSEGSEGVHMNGDREAMDVDAASPSAADADAEEDPEPASPEETEVVEVPERYDSMDVATQTEVKAGPKTTTMYWTIDKPGTTVLHSLWNPSPDPSNAQTLLSVGEGLCRFHAVSSEIDGLEGKPQVLHGDDPNLPPNSISTASAWHPDGQTAICAVDSLRILPEGRETTQQMLLEHHAQSDSTVFNLGPPLLEPQAIVLCLRYSPNGDHLLVLRTNLRRGLVQILDMRKHHGENEPTIHAEPIAWQIFENPALDACWIDNYTFAVAGEDGLSCCYTLDDASPPTPVSLTADTVSQHGLLEACPRLFATSAKWDRICFARGSDTNTLIVASTESRILTARTNITMPLTQREPAGPDAAIVNLPGQLTALAVDTKEAPSKPSSGLRVAAAFEQGFCTIYDVTSTEPGIAHFQELSTVDLAEGPALGLAFSPDRNYLAVAGADMVQIWRTDSLRAEKDGMPAQRVRPMVTWRFDHEAAAMTAGVDGRVENGEKEVVAAEPSLSWSADGERLMFAVDKQIAVIGFRPPLHDVGNDGQEAQQQQQAEEANGGSSP